MIGFPALLFGQFPYYQIFNTQNGLPGNNVYDIYQDSKGYMWFAGDFGIARYDGYRFKAYKQQRQKARSGTNIQEDAQGRIWYCTFTGTLYYVDKDSLYEFVQPDLQYHYIFKIKGDYLFAGFNNQGSRGTEIRNIRTMEQIKTLPLQFRIVEVRESSCIAYISETNEANTLLEIYEIMFSGAYKKIIDLGKATERQPAGIVLVTSLKNDLWVVPQLGVMGNTTILEIKEKEIFAKYRLNKELFCQAFTSWGDTLWLSTTKGLYLFNPEKGILNPQTPWFPTISFSKVFRNREGNLWLGTTNSGVILIPDIRTQNFTLTQERINHLYSHNDSLWVGTKSGTLLQTSNLGQRVSQLYKDPYKHEIQFIYNDIFTSNVYVGSGDLSLVKPGNRKITKKGVSGPKSICRIDSEHIATASSSGLLLSATKRNALHKNNSPWNKWFSPDLSPQMSKMVFRIAITDTLLAREEIVIMKEMRCSGIVKPEGLEKAYFISNQGLYLLSPDTLREITYKGERIIADKILTYKKRVFVKTLYNQVLEVLENESLKNCIGEMEIVKTQLSENFLFLFSDRATFYVDLNAPDFVLNPLYLPVPTIEINDICLFKGQLCIATDKVLFALPFRSNNIGPYLPIFLLQGFRVNDKSFFMIPNGIFLTRKTIYK